MMVKEFPQKDESLLLIVDFQDTILGIFKEKIVNMLKKNVKILIEMAKKFNLPIVVMEQNNEKLKHTNPEIQETLGEYYKPLNKIYFSGYRDIKIRETLKKSGKNDIIICGIETHICVFQTAMDLINDAYNVYVVADAVGSRYKVNWQVGLNKMKNLGCKILTTEMLLFYFLEKVGTDEFRHFLPLLK